MPIDLSWILSAVSLMLTFALLLPVGVLLLQCLLALLPRGRKELPLGRRPSIAILIPAHNESSGILLTLKSLSRQLTEQDRLLVVADNCSDDTAQIAAQAGAEVVQRFDTERRGKGYALDYGLRHLAQRPPEVVIIVDADCIVADGAVERLARTSLDSGRPVQALYLMKAPRSATPMKAIAEFAWLVKNLVRPLGWARLGFPCQLMGTGMAFPWPQLMTANLASGHIVEDMKLGVDLAVAGTPPLFCIEARVTSYFPASEEGTQSQRTRWEHGHLSMIFSEAPRLFAAGLKRRSLGLIAMALDLCIPPVALLVLLSLATGLLALLVFAVFGIVWPLIASSLLLFGLALAVLIAWQSYGQSVISLRGLALAIGYVFWKVPLYLKFMVNRQVEWVRSKRDTN